MLRALYIPLAFVSLLPNAEPPVSAAARAANGVHKHILRSEFQAGETFLRVLVPDEIADSRRFAVMYVLPVERGDEDKWGNSLNEVRNHDLHNKYGLICVFPTFSHLPWYADHPTDKMRRQESYFIADIVPFVEKNYPALRGREGRLLIGFSKSGWGAFSLLLRHPEMFGRAAAWDAPLMMKQPNRYGMGPVFCSQENFEKYKVAELFHLRKQQLTGSTRLILTGYGNFQDHHDRAHTLLSDLNIPHVYRAGPQRKHSWHSGWLAEAVELLMEDLERPLPHRCVEK